MGKVLLSLLRILDLQPDGKTVLACSLRKGIDIHDFAVVRYLSDFDVEILYLSTIQRHVLVYPNPIQLETNIQFELDHQETLSFDIQDFNGKKLDIAVPQQYLSASAHTLTIQLPSSLSAGSYLLVISNAKRQQQAIRIQKVD